MKKIILALICLTIAATAFAQSAAQLPTQEDPVEGFWLSVDDNTNKVTAGWKIYIRNNIVYGEIISLANFKKGMIAVPCKESYHGFPIPGKVNTMPVAGTPWIFGLTKHKRGEWRGGSLINPEDGRMYNCRITFHPADNKKHKEDTLEMRGEIGLGIGRSQFWKKTDEATASNLWPE